MSRITVQGADLPPPIPGVPPIPPRRNITDLMKDDKQWSLYIQALLLLQQQDPDQPLSWFSYSSIHGYPLELEWQDGGEKTDPGYCTHADPRFPTWHRPLLALYEQALSGAALEVAKQYTANADDWGRAALTLRSPYWDWADPATYLPPAQVYDYNKYPTLRVTTPSGPANVPNPLLAYTFQRDIDWPYSQYSATVRHPSAANPITDFVNDVKNNAVQGRLQLALWNTLTRLTTWDELSNARAVNGQRANSLETLHNWIHNRTGADGHMGDTISAAYDPLFLLHHTNVDRQLALWQALHPQVWISGAAAQSELRPFWKTQADFHRSSDEPVRKFTEFKATYPEFIGLENATPDQLQQAIQQKVDALYKPRTFTPGLPIRGGLSGSAPQQLQTQRALPGGISPTPPGHGGTSPTPPGHGNTLPSNTSPTPPGHGNTLPSNTSPTPPGHGNFAPTPPGHGNYRRVEWIARLRVRKFTLGQSFNILLFLGAVPDDPKKWLSSPNFIGSHSEFVNSNPKNCGNCSNNADVITEGFIELTHALQERGYENKSEAEIEKYLHDQIHWKIQKLGGNVVLSSDLDVLEIAVATVDVTGGPHHAPLVFHDITSHKEGGYDPNNQPYDL